MLRKILVSFAIVASLALPIANSASAAIEDGIVAAGHNFTRILPIDTVQYIYGGHNYCWYDDGWNGPGWYWCGQYLTSGIGWGGGYGWHHWHGGHPSAYYHGAHANVSHANVSHARVSHARVSHANVSHANVSHANVSHGGGGGGAAHGGGGGGAAHGGGGGGHGRH